MKRLTLVVWAVAAWATIGAPMAHAQRQRDGGRSPKSLSQPRKQFSRSLQKTRESNRRSTTTSNTAAQSGVVE